MRQDEGRRHRLRQHRHRPDDQDPAAAETPRDGRDGRHRPGSDGLARAAGWGSRRPTRASTGSSRCRNSTTSTSSSTPPRPGAHQANAAALRAARQAAHRPDPGRDRSLRRPGGQPRRAPRRPERQHGHLRRAGHDPDRRGHLPRRRRVATPRSSPRSRPSPPVRARAPTSTSSPRPPRTRSSRSAAPAAARRSSSSTRPSRR